MKAASKGKRTPPHSQAVAGTQAAFNRVRAVKLRLEGKTLRQIGETLGVHHTTVAEYIQAELAAERKLGVHERQQLRDIERARLELVLERMMAMATRADFVIQTVKEGARGPVTITVEDYQAAVKGADMVVKISARLAALDGLDAPVKQEHSGTVAVENLAIVRARIDAVKARRAAGA